jgi:hypothetical protein
MSIQLLAKLPRAPKNCDALPHFFGAHFEVMQEVYFKMKNLCNFTFSPSGGSFDFIALYIGVAG